MAFSIAQLNAIETAIGTGELTVEFEGKKVVYRSIADLRSARDLIRSELVAIGLVTDTTPRRVYTSFSKD
jgi:hypothetical protein